VDAARALDAIEAIDSVRRLLRILQPREREAVVRFYLDDQPQREVASRMGLTPKAVEDLLYRAMRRLRLVAAQC
jgi:RNA polymerase sigma factor (sigma-70 family)